MKHPDAEQLLSHYYERDEDTGDHLAACLPCRTEFERSSGWLDEVRKTAVAEPDAEYEKRLWAGVQPHLRRRRTRTRAAAWAAGITAATAALGVFSTRLYVTSTPGAAAGDGVQVVNAAVAAYLGQAQVLLTEVAHHSATEAATEAEQARARELVEDGRLLRAALQQHGDGKRALGLQDLEPTLLTLANGAAQMKPEEWRDLQSRVKNNGLVFKVAVMRGNLTKGNPL